VDCEYPWHNKCSTGYPEVVALKKEVFSENAEKSSGYIVCSVVSLGSGEFWEHVRGQARVAAEPTSRGSFRM